MLPLFQTQQWPGSWYHFSLFRAISASRCKAGQMAGEAFTDVDKGVLREGMHAKRGMMGFYLNVKGWVSGFKGLRKFSSGLVKWYRWLWVFLYWPSKRSENGGYCKFVFSWRWLYLCSHCIYFCLCFKFEFILRNVAFKSHSNS